MKNIVCMLLVNIPCAVAMVGALRMGTCWVGQGPNPYERSERWERWIIQWMAAAFWAFVLVVTVGEAVEYLQRQG